VLPTTEGTSETLGSASFYSTTLATLEMRDLEWVAVTYGAFGGEQKFRKECMPGHISKVVY
jgi:hypothetical protein